MEEESVALSFYSQLGQVRKDYERHLQNSNLARSHFLKLQEAVETIKVDMLVLKERHEKLTERKIQSEKTFRDLKVSVSVKKLSLREFTKRLLERKNDFKKNQQETTSLDASFKDDLKQCIYRMENGKFVDDLKREIKSRLLKKKEEYHEKEEVKNELKKSISKLKKALEEKERTIKILKERDIIEMEKKVKKCKELYTKMELKQRKDVDRFKMDLERKKKEYEVKCSKAHELNKKINSVRNEFNSKIDLARKFSMKLSSLEKKFRSLEMEINSIQSSPQSHVQQKNFRGHVHNQHNQNFERRRNGFVPASSFRGSPGSGHGNRQSFVNNNNMSRSGVNQVRYGNYRTDERVQQRNVRNERFSRNERSGAGNEEGRRKQRFEKSFSTLKRKRKSIRLPFDDGDELSDDALLEDDLIRPKNKKRKVE